MTDSQIQTLNYCTHAIEDLQELEASFRFTAPKSALVVKRLIDMLNRSVKFILPNCCSLVDPEDIKQSHLELTRLPFPIVAFEAPWIMDTQTGVLNNLSTKRIALCWDAKPEFELFPGLNNFLEIYPEGGTFVAPICYINEKKKWIVTPGGAFVPYKNKLGKFNFDAPMAEATRISTVAAIEAGMAKASGKTLQMEPFPLFIEFYERMVGANGENLQKVNAEFILNARDEVQTLVQACSVINCANVTTADVLPPTALNKKRVEKGKQPFFTYKILQLSEDRGSTRKNDIGGSHSSPRMHLRRGHLRRLEERTIWVRPAMVNAGTDAGVVLKDYAIKPKS